MRILIIVTGFLLFAGCTAKPTYQKTELTWEKDIKTIFEHNCIECHGLNRVESRLNLLDERTIKENLWLIYKTVIQKQVMPPTNNLNINLSQGDRLKINSWIRGNAPGIGTGEPY